MIKMLILAENGIKIPAICWAIQLLPITLIAMGAVITIFKHRP